MVDGRIVVPNGGNADEEKAGGISTSRSFGDFDFKLLSTGASNSVGDLIICRPEVRVL